MNKEIVIVAATRTPIGGFQGALAQVPAPMLGAAVIKGLVRRVGIAPQCINEVLMGNVLSAGVGQAPARQAAIHGGLPHTTCCTTMNKVCGSGMKAIMLAADQIQAGSAEVVIAGGMESMSLAPYLLPSARSGQRLGHGQIVDHLFLDGLQNAYDGELMGCFADINAKADGITREQMDAYAIESLKRAQEAIAQGHFASEIESVTVSTRKETRIIDVDEQPNQLTAEKIPQLKPAFGKAGLVTAANASSLADGAAGLMIMTADRATSLGLAPLAIIRGYCCYAQAPEKFTHAPIGAIQSLLVQLKWQVADVDLFEVNEAFAMVPLAVMQALELSHEKTNIHGGATALGHPIGASGARVVVTLLHALKRLGQQKGIASVCIGGGESTAIALEIMD